MSRGAAMVVTLLLELITIFKVDEYVLMVIKRDDL